MGNDKKAFTLAEVLITLAVIGIVAAMTIPSIVASNQKLELETRFAKSYRTIMYMVNMAVAENGSFENWEWLDSYSAQEMDDFVKKYFLPYLNVVKFCSASAPEGCFAEKLKNPNGAYEPNPSTRNLPKVLLADGTSVQFLIMSLKAKNRTIAIEVDVNGFRKPNIVGRDVFAFNIYPFTNEILPHGVYDKSVPYDETTKSYKRHTQQEIDDDCVKGTGWHCSTKVVQDGFKINY